MRICFQLPYCSLRRVYVIYLLYILISTLYFEINVISVSEDSPTIAYTIHKVWKLLAPVRWNDASSGSAAWLRR